MKGAGEILIFETNTSLQCTRTHGIVRSAAYTASLVAQDKKQWTRKIMLAAVYCTVCLTTYYKVESSALQIQETVSFLDIYYI